VTRPVFEPTSQRQIRKLGFSADQLFRRPAPASADAGGGEWCRLGFENDTTFTLGQRNIVDWDVEANPYPTVYTVVDAPPGGDGNAIQILENGVYAVTWGLYIDVFTPDYPTNSTIWVSFEHTTWTHEEEAFVFPPLADDAIFDMASPIITGSKVFRSGPTYDEVYMAVTTASTSDSDLTVIGGDLNITYMEIVRLHTTDAATQGDPNDFITGP
jgi:hypothetical protein